MSAFTDDELAYLTQGARLARLATADADGLPHVTPVGTWRHNPHHDTIDVGGRDFAGTKKFRNVLDNPQASIVVDDLASTEPWRPRAVMVQGPAVAMRHGDDGTPIIRITPDTVVSWGLES